MKKIKTFKLFKISEKKFEDINKEDNNTENIESICKKFGIRNWSVNTDGGIDVDGDVNLRGMELDKLPLKFGKVTDVFDCSRNKLTNLVGSPKEVGRDFNCTWNKLETLEGAPIYVGERFFCQDNKLTSLEGAPKELGRGFNCSGNKLTSLLGGPIYVGKGFDCQDNKLTSLEGAPKEFGEDFYFDCEGNPIHSVYELFPDYKSFMDSLDYNYLRGSSIDKKRLEEALGEFDIKMPKRIRGWKWI
jgi:hypothetical protein